MFDSFTSLFSLKKNQRDDLVSVRRPKFIITRTCLGALQDCLAPEIRKGHEGIAYLLGRTDGTFSLAISVFRPESQTTPGSFYVEPVAMAKVVRRAADLSLQIVAQVHTHPRAAYHSDGDIEGARIRYPGYASIVLPDYGRRLPRLEEAAVYVFQGNEGWLEVDADEVVIVPDEYHG